MIQRQWVVSSGGVMAAWDPATRKILTRRVHTGQTPSPPDQLTGPEAAGILGLLGGFMLLIFAIESLPVALIAKYGFGASWGKSIALGVGSALGFNLISSALSPKPATPVLPGPSTPGSPATLPGVSATNWPVGGVVNPNGMTWNEPLMMGTGSSSGVQLGDPYSLVAPTGVQIVALTVDNPAIFKVVGGVAPTLPASVIHLTAVAKGTATFNAQLSDGSTSQQATTVG